ncbi:hypothetical protein NA57DRAFT_55130 [Rhizodiscina lignyota]|uniref:Nucleotidylyl transferase n=1 Tax=Rhizodiscina lignyota TaxID=1504668 RepID=A0A9P4M7V0_9PEZI|nr:hypothetical protein NA57DRAFT_55130 [Rhizodiscina lignyota]
MTGTLNQNSKQLLKHIEASLSAFQSSNRPFRILSSSRTTETAAAPLPKTLFILDSSYNPPSKAHFALAYAALAGPSAQREPKPHRLLLLFSTQNADKAAKPASFSQRLAMMGRLMEDLASEIGKVRKDENVDIDIGVTTSPYYVGKSQAIEACDPPAYPSKPNHVHIIGYDTVTRLLASRYYPDHHPPLSALEPYFCAGHKLLVALRPLSSSENMQDAGSQGIDEQTEYIRKLGEDALEAEGFKREWAAQISVLEGEDLGSAIGISSTAIRNAVSEEDWTAVGKLCTPGVTTWLKEERPYENSSQDVEQKSKMS